jgi:hypothetical protein
LFGTGFPDGDVNDEKTVFSIFPGNTNQLLSSLKPYSNVKQVCRSSLTIPAF